MKQYYMYKLIIFITNKNVNKRKKATIKAHEEILNYLLRSFLILSFFDQFINRYFHNVSFDLKKSNSSDVKSRLSN